MPIRTEERDDRVLVIDDGVVLAEYVHRPTDVQLESPRPYFSPIRTLGGEVVSLFRPHDHVWHKGIAWSLPVVGDENFWGGPTFVSGQGYVQLPNNGTQAHREFDERSDAAVGARLVERLDWVTEAGEHRLRRTAHRRRDRARRRRLAARVRDADAQRVRSRPPHRLADDPRPRERRLRRAVLARPALVHGRRPARARRRGRRRAPRHPRALDGIQRAARRHRRRLDDRDGRRPRQRAVIPPGGSPAARSSPASARPRSSATSTRSSPATPSCSATAS